MSQYLMRAVDSVTGDPYQWLAPTPDWDASDYPGPNAATKIFIVTKVGATGGGGSEPEEPDFEALPDADTTIDFGESDDWLLPAETLTDDRTATLDPATATAGETYRVRRDDATANTYTLVNGGPLGGDLELEADKMVSFYFDGEDFAELGTVDV